LIAAIAVFQKTRSSPAIHCAPKSWTRVSECVDPAEIERARMNRMEANLLKPELSMAPEAAGRLRKEWAGRFEREPDAMGRMEIITEMPQLDDAATVDLMLELLRREQNSKVREQIVLMMGFMRTTHLESGKVVCALVAEYQSSKILDE